MGAKGMINRLTDAYTTANQGLKDNAAGAATAYQPFTSAGVGAINRLADPNASFQASPDYQFRLGQGLQGVTQSKAVGGLLHSGSALKGLNDYAQGTASSEFGNWWNRQAGLAGLGLQSTNALQDINTQTAMQTGQNAVNLANGVNGIKQQAQANTNSLWGSILGAGAALATGGMSLPFTGGMRASQSGIVPQAYDGGYTPLPKDVVRPNWGLG